MYTLYIIPFPLSNSYLLNIILFLNNMTHWFQFMMLGALASVVLLIEIRLQIPWRRRVSQIIVLMFFISIPWTWF